MPVYRCVCVCVVLFNSSFPPGSADLTCLALQPELTMKSQSKRQLSPPINQQAVGFCCSLSEEASALALGLGVPLHGPPGSELAPHLGMGLNLTGGSSHPVLGVHPLPKGTT